MKEAYFKIRKVKLKKPLHGGILKEYQYIILKPLEKEIEELFKKLLEDKEIISLIIPIDEIGHTPKQSAPKKEEQYKHKKKP